MALLGVGQYTAEVRRLSADGQLAGLIRLPVENMVRLEWTRRMAATSRCDIRFRSLPIDIASKIRTVWHELGVYRDGVEVWSGPIIRKDTTRDGVRVTARDVSWWLPGKQPRRDAKGDIDLADAARRLLDDTHPGRSYELRAPTAAGIVGSIDRKVEANQSAFSHLNTLTQLGLQWTAVGNAIYAGATIGDASNRTLRFPRLTDRHFLRELSVSERGDLAATDIRVVGAGGQVATAAAGDVDDAFRIEKVILRPNVYSRHDLERIANEELALRWPAPVIIEIPSGSQLAPDAPVDINHLIPGAIGVVEVQPAQAAALMELDTVTVRVVNGRETVEVVMPPAPVQP